MVCSTVSIGACKVCEEVHSDFLPRRGGEDENGKGLMLDC